MASLNGQTIASSYEQLLHVDRDGGGNTSNLVNVKDGDNGTTFCISMTDASTGKAILAVDGSHANGTEIQIDNSATDGDAFLSFQLSGTSKFTMGVDDGDSDKFKIGTTAIGTGTMFALDTNSKISLSNNDSNTANTVLGYSAFNTSSDNASDNNTAIGHEAMGTGAVAEAVDNVAVGYKALEDITSGDNNTGVGSNAGVSITTGSQCTAVGHQALNANQTASYLTAIGNNALIACTASENTGVGWDAGGAIVGGTHNCMIGGNAGDTLTTGSQNTCLGDSADVSGTGSANQTAVGYNAAGQADNSVTLGNASVTDLYLASNSGARFTIGTGGAVTMPNQPAMLAIMGRFQTTSHGGNSHTMFNLGLAGKIPVIFNLEKFDQGGDFNNTTKTGTADATETNKLHDADGGFASTDVGALVYNTTDNTYARITSFQDSGEVTLESICNDGADIMASGEHYVISHSKFTAPVTGKYMVTANIRLLNIDTATSYLNIYITASNRTPSFSMQLPDSDIPVQTVSQSMLLDMDANDTLRVDVRQNTGTKQMDILGDSDAGDGQDGVHPYTALSVHLVC